MKDKHEYKEELIGYDILNHTKKWQNIISNLY